MSAVDITLVLPPPFSVDKPHLGLACLAAYAQHEGLSVEVCDLNLELYAAADEQEQTLWHRTRDAACYWNYPGSVLRFLARHEAAIDALLGQILSRRPKVVGLSCHMTNTYLALLIAERLRGRGPDDLVIVAGGPRSSSTRSTLPLRPRRTATPTRTPRPAARRWTGTWRCWTGLSSVRGRRRWPRSACGSSRARRWRA